MTSYNLLKQVKILFWFTLFQLIPFQCFTQFQNYISLNSEEKFQDGSNIFEPLFMNYIINFNIDVPNNDYYISPHWNYSTIYANPPNTGGVDRFCFSSNNDRAASQVKLSNDIDSIKKLGFNVIRITPTISWVNDEIVYPTGNIDSYFSLLSEYFDLLESKDMRVVWVLNADKAVFSNLEKYTNYLSQVSAYFKNEKAIFAYVIFAEPYYIWPKSTKNDKLLISNWAKEWYFTMKANSPSHLITFGIQSPETVVNWDPKYLTSDFSSFHFYSYKSDLNYTKNLLDSYFYWAKNNITDPWVIGETGYSGTSLLQEQNTSVGSDLQQLNFVNHYLQKSKDCNCSGYSWWQYQELDWGNDYPRERYFGLINRYPNENKKLAANSFLNYNNLSNNLINCTKPGAYYNAEAFSNNVLFGRVLDQDGIPIKDAVITGVINNQEIFTYSESNGYFNLKYNQPGVVSQIWISYPGYSVKQMYNPINNSVYRLSIFKYNNWMKMWTNDETNLFENLSLNNTENYYKGDFNGDNKEDILLVKGSNNNLIINLYSFIYGQFKLIWSNNGQPNMGHVYVYSNSEFIIGDFLNSGKDQVLIKTNGNLNLLGFNANNWQSVWNNNSNIGWINGWHILSNDVFKVGDFNGDSKDDLMCVQKNSGMNFCNIYTFNSQNNNWDYLWTNNGNNWIGEWNIGPNDLFYIADINGDSRSDLICCQVGGNSDWITMLRFNQGWNRLWSNNGNPNVGVYPYRNKLIPGNFDTDASDEILGISTWATKFDFEASNLNWNWSTYNSAKFSDWNVNTSSKMFFFRPIQFAPDYLFTQNSINAISKINLYSMNYLIQGSTTKLKSDNIFTSIKENENDKKQMVERQIKVVPNVNDGKFVINFNSDINLPLTIEISSSNGQLVYKEEIESSNGRNEIMFNLNNLNSGLYYIRLFGKTGSFFSKMTILN